MPAIVAHLTLIGKSFTPERDIKVVFWFSFKLFNVINLFSLIKFKKSSIIFLAKLKSLPFKISVKIEAEAKDIAHPSPSKLISKIFLSLSSCA